MKEEEKEERDVEEREKKREEIRKRKEGEEVEREEMLRKQKSMTLGEFEDLKREAEEKMGQILLDFTKKTGKAVDSVRLERIVNGWDKVVIYDASFRIADWIG